MKVAIIGSNNFDSLEFHLKDELDTQNHNCEIFNYTTVVSKRLDAGISLVSAEFVVRRNKKLLDRVVSFQPDLVIGVYRHIHPLVIKGIKDQGIRIIHVNPDQITTLQNQQLFVEPYDLYFSKDPYMVRFMRDKLRLNTMQYSEAFNPRYHIRPQMDSLELEHQVNIDVLCFGNLYPYRNRMIKLLTEEGAKFTLYGVKAKFFDEALASNFKNKGIYGAEKSKILNGSKICFNNFHYAEIESVNNKFFEISGSGAFQICDYKPILHELLPIDPKLISFVNLEGANRLIKTYLNEPEQRFEIRDRIMTHFLHNYTYKHLVQFILNEI
jgi:spore maturation protein CgeB